MLIQELSDAQIALIQPILDEIDKILKRDCIFCGSIYLDMIDNDLSDSDDEAKVEISHQRGFMEYRMLPKATQQTKEHVWKYDDMSDDEADFFDDDDEESNMLVETDYRRAVPDQDVRRATQDSNFDVIEELDPDNNWKYWRQQEWKIV